MYGSNCLESTICGRLNNLICNQERILMMEIEYTSPNGYRGVLYGTSSMIIYDANGTEVLHTGSRIVNNLEELKVVVEQMPELSKQLDKLSIYESARYIVSVVR